MPISQEMQRSNRYTGIPKYNHQGEHLETAQTTLRKTDQCVKCGLCLPHCPTYQVTHNESDSPRGRIALIAGLASQQLAASEDLAKHLESCLLCRACESVCPSGVEFANLMDTSRQHLQQHKLMKFGRTTSHRLLLSSCAKKSKLRKFQRLLRLSQRSGLLQLITHLRFLPNAWQEWCLLLPTLSKLPKWQSYYPALGEQHGQVALFTGCIGEILDPIAIQSGIKLLNNLGYAVHVPAQQQCCGALHSHSGLNQTHQDLHAQNARAFKLDVQAIVGTASGCLAQLSEDGIAAASGPNNLSVQDIGHFIAACAWPAQLNARPLPARVAYHEPCTLRNSLKQNRYFPTLLKRIPQIELVPLESDPSCCGFAGNYRFTNPEIANDILAQKRKIIKQIAPDYIVTPNIGCDLQLRLAAHQANRKIQVMHPITLLERQLSL